MQTISEKYSRIETLDKRESISVSVYQEIKTGRLVQIKAEELGLREGRLSQEAKTLTQLQHISGVPRLVEHFSEEGMFYLVLQLLGPSLSQLIIAHPKGFGLKTTLMLGLQALQLLEQVHRSGLVHRQIQPCSFYMGLSSSSHQLYLMDYSLAKPITCSPGLPSQAQHLPYREGKRLIGTVRFASLNSHLGIELTRRDDLLSLCYVLLFFLKGSLPWDVVSSGQSIVSDQAQKHFQVKSSVLIETLCKGLPAQFYYMLRYCSSLRFADMPDYQFLHSNLQDLMNKCQFSFDYHYIWINKKYQQLSKNMQLIIKQDNDHEDGEHFYGSHSEDKDQECTFVPLGRYQGSVKDA